MHEAEVKWEMCARDTEAAWKIREAKTLIELADIEAEIERQIVIGSLTSSRRSCHTIRKRGQSTITGSRAVCEYEQAPYRYPGCLSCSHCVNAAT